ncbi:hypothetical protein G3T36_04360 [Diaminobutyricibacter tongyongensis]|uniref:Uncharacterized protein n=1 Tax=Leifsonia tongyongensis TaxID=1268043 RepID=A0A6L9XUL8_9MICO|nr:hypothetical protein [Diaminobutyricibacter tongyongensis]NEN05099.1 hypothetical protein [Diaminobutyricibacter tongyongensis]
MNNPYGISVDPDMAAQRANALLESEIKARIDAVRELAQRMNALDAAILEYELAWQAAKQAGWSDERLREIGLHSPDESAPVAGRRAAAASTPTPTLTSAPAPVASSPSVAPVVQLPTPTPAVAPVAPVVPVTFGG